MLAEQVPLAQADLAYVGRLARFFAKVLKGLRGRPFAWQEAVGAGNAVGPHAVGPVAVIMAAVGSIAAIQGVSVLRRFGAENLLPLLLAQAIVRDFAPAMTALMLAAQAGTSFAGELGAMRVGEEVDALEVGGVDPVQYLVVPRILALAVLTPLVTAVGAGAALVGAYVVASVGYGAAAGFWTELARQISGPAVVEAGLKAVLFGTIVGVLACFNGLETSGGAEGVGRAANRTVVQAILAIAAVNTLITGLLLGSGR